MKQLTKCQQQQNKNAMKKLYFYLISFMLISSYSISFTMFSLSNYRQQILNNTRRARYLHRLARAQQAEQQRIEASRQSLTRIIHDMKVKSCIAAAAA